MIRDFFNAEIIKMKSERAQKMAQFRAQMLELAKEYGALYEEGLQLSKSYVPASGKNIGTAELCGMIEASLDMNLTAGRFNDQFELELAEKIGVNFALTTNSGSSANLLAFTTLTSPKLKERRLRKGDEVITVAAGFPTTVNPILQNGLVRAGFDRNFGSVQIHVYDKESAKWVYVNSLKVKNFNDFSIISYSDDMISIGFGETTWTLWRGRPFLQVEHPNDDLIVLDDYDTVTCERLVDTDGYVHHDGDLEEIYLHRLRTSTVLSSAQDEYYVDEPVELIACVFDAYGDKISVDENNKTMGEVDYYIDGEFYDTVLEPYRPYTWTDLQEQILELNDGDTLILDNNYEYNSEIDSSLIDGVSIDKDLTIVCEGYDFMCDNQALIFTILPNCTLTVQDGCFSEGRVNEELSSTTVFPSEEEDSETKTDKYYYATVHGKLQLINMKIQTAEDEFILDYNGSIEGQGNITDTTNMKSGE